MCDRNERMPVWLRLACVLPMLSFVSIQYLKPGVWRHLILVVEIVLLIMVIVMRIRERRSTRSAADLPGGRVRGEVPPGRPR
jgi:Flp pilus assembly protein TadB